MRPVRHFRHLLWRRPLPAPALLAKKSGKIFRVGIFLDFVWLTTRAPHGAYVRRARRNRIDPHGGGIERLATRTHTLRALFRAECRLHLADEFRDEGLDAKGHRVGPAVVRVIVTKRLFEQLEQLQDLPRVQDRTQTPTEQVS